DLLRRAWPQAKLGAQDNLAVLQLRVPVTQPELGGSEPAGAVRRGDERALQHTGEVAAVGTSVHPDAAADRAGNGAGELEATQPAGASQVQRDGVRGASTYA